MVTPENEPDDDAKAAQREPRDAGDGAPSASADQELGQPFPQPDPPDDA